MGVVVVGLLDSRQLDVQFSYFKITMSCNVEVVMWEPTYVNLVTWMRSKIQLLSPLVQKLSE